MNYDSVPPVYYDDPSSVFDEAVQGLSQRRLPMKYVALKLNEKTLDQKLDLTTTLAAALTAYATLYANPDPSPTC